MQAPKLGRPGQARRTDFRMLDLTQFFEVSLESVGDSVQASFLKIKVCLEQTLLCPFFFQR